MIKYICKTDKIQLKTSSCPLCKKRAEMSSDLYWCSECNIPLYKDKCSICGENGRRIATDIRPVFPQERLLLELLLKVKPMAYVKNSVWKTSAGYIIDGKIKRLPESVYANADIQDIGEKLKKYELENDSEYFEEYIQRFIRANRERYNEISNEAIDYIEGIARQYSLKQMFVSFSGGKDSTVVSSLVMRALGPEILHLYGDTTLEFPETYEYVGRFKGSHPKTLILSSRNKDKDFSELCTVLGPPSRLMRWCCTVFKTGAIARKIESLFKNEKEILTFYGIRRSESVSRSKYDRESDSPKITIQKTVSPIIDWMDFDVWLYILTTGVDFNYAYRLGYARVGCWCCPNNSVWSEFLSKIYMPEQYKKFRSILLNFAKEVGKEDAEVYVNQGNWKRRQGGNGVGYAQKSVISFAPCATEENSFNYELQRPIGEELYELFKPFGYLNFEIGNQRLGEVYVLDRKGNMILRLQGRMGSSALKVTIINKKLLGSKSLRAAEEKVKCQITKYQMCMSCRACESVCKHHAIKIQDKEGGRVSYRISDELCVRCKECVNHFEGGCYLRKVLCIKR